MNILCQLLLFKYYLPKYLEERRRYHQQARFVPPPSFSHHAPLGEEVLGDVLVEDRLSVVPLAEGVGRPGLLHGGAARRHATGVHAELGQGQAPVGARGTGSYH